MCHRSKSCSCNAICMTFGLQRFWHWLAFFVVTNFRPCTMLPETWVLPLHSFAWHGWSHRSSFQHSSCIFENIWIFFAYGFLGAPHQLVSSVRGAPRGVHLSESSLSSGSTKKIDSFQFLWWRRGRRRCPHPPWRSYAGFPWTSCWRGRGKGRGTGTAGREGSRRRRVKVKRTHAHGWPCGWLWSARLNLEPMCVDEIKMTMRSVHSGLSVEVFSGVRIVRSHAIMQVVIDACAVQCHAKRTCCHWRPSRAVLSTCK